MPSNRQRDSALRHVETAAPGCPGGYDAPFTNASLITQFGAGPSSLDNRSK